MKTLQKRMILALFLSITVVFMILLGLVYFSVGLYFRQQATAMVNLIKENGGVIPDEQETDDDTNQLIKKYSKTLDFDEESPYRTRYFLIHYDQNGNISQGDYAHIAAANKDKAVLLTKKILNGTKEKGYIDGYFFEKLKGTDIKNVSESSELTTEKQKQADSGIIIFLDCNKELELLKTVIIRTSIILILLCSLVTFVFGLISGKIIKPFEENSRKQKQFITDASHELKTPLAIISANADVLRYKDGDNIWLDNITGQTKQMNRLIGDLLALTKADEMSDDFVKENIDLTVLIHGIWKSFEEAAQCKNVSMHEELPQNLIIRGNREMLERLFSVLTENAIKYVSDHGEIRLTLKQSRKWVIISLYNTAHLEKDFDCSHLFDRFYRPDTSRTSMTGGHGIGLSIAQKITDNHKGKIIAKCIEEGICFEVTLPK